MPDDYCVILCTAANQDEASRIAESLVTRRLAACVQTWPVASTYIWKGELNRDQEHLLVIKTTAQRYGEVEAAILANHSYELPEILQLPVVNGLDRYLGWIAETVKSRTPSP
jgi:periplasmic divalent cation tolerance protein